MRETGRGRETGDKDRQGDKERQTGTLVKGFIECSHRGLLNNSYAPLRELLSTLISYFLVKG